MSGESVTTSGGAAAAAANGAAGNATNGRGARVRASGSKRTGLTVERVWTTEGVHPYDEVAWQRRDVVMTNWRDGSINFEQRGVEFPDFWSVNAANIVTTKYFRGAVGTPAREWSLKQLIDRVVKTYRAAGEEHGYFATPADAEIFEHELTWMLLHQVFSFNSPVWFNVGTTSPQQVSACLPYDSLVSTPGGLVPIGELVEGNAVGAKVYDAAGLTRILAVKANGVREVIRLHTKAGYQLDVTPDHVVWKSTGSGTGRWVEAGTLHPGDQLEWHRTYAYGEDEIDLREIREAALAGWLQSDGFVGQYDEGTNSRGGQRAQRSGARDQADPLGSTSLTIEAMTVNDDELDWVTGLLDEVFPGAHRHERTVATQSDALDCRRTRLYGEHLRPFVEKWDLLKRGTEMEVPESLFTAPLPVVAAYLRSIFQAEGYVSARERSTLVAVDMISEKVIRGVQSLLLRFGIFAHVGYQADARADRKGCWSVRISNDGDRDLFATHIGFIGAEKMAKLERSFALAGRPAADVKRLEIDRVEPLGAMEVYDIQTESGEFLAGNLRVHNCFILAVDDSMDSILDWYKEEGLIFKGGSGSGVNLSRIRSSKELLSSGGTASGPVSFMRGADASAGTIKSGGATRRAAKMVILDVDHPDVEEFVLTKAREENKIRALRDAGFDMDLGGSDIVSVQYQNANNSVRVSDEFMRAVADGGTFDLRSRLDGSVIETIEAKGLFRTISQAAWDCADPGLQYDDTINDWHTCPETGRITASNPCFTADTLVHTDKGLIRFDALIDRARQGETFGVYTHDATNPDEPADRIMLTTPEALMITGTNEIVRLEFSNGMVLRCTPNHRIWTTNRGYVEARELTADDKVLPVNLPTPAVAASREFRLRPGSSVRPGDVVSTKWQRESRLPEKWTEDFAHLLGWLTGDGCVRTGAVDVRGDNPVAAWVYSDEDRQAFLPRHQATLTEIMGFVPKPSEQPNGTVQLRASRGAVVDFLVGLGVTTGRASNKRLPAAVLEAPTEIQAEFLRGLFDADGCVAQTRNDTRYVGLGSVSGELLRDVQRLLSCFGIGSRIYPTRKAGDTTFAYTTVGGEDRTYAGGTLYDLRISGQNIATFSAAVGFSHPRKAERLATWLREHRFYRTDQTATLVKREFDGFETTYNLSEPRNHSYVANGIVVRNCSEYLHLDNSSCNLASLNLLKFLRADGGFEVEKFVKSVEFVITAMDISICFADFPTEKIGVTTRAYRQLGIGYANLGALLMASGLPYDSEAGRSLSAGITSLMTGTAYRRSAELAGVVGPYEGYARNAEPHKRVMRKHAAASDEIRPSGDTATAIVREATRQWQLGNKLGEKNGWRNAQASVLAPTGCLTGDTLVTTDRGLTRLSEIGDVYGDRWQDLDMRVSTDEGTRQATKFFVNGEEPTRRVVTDGGYRIQGTLAHRIKVVDPTTGQWVWKRMAEVAPGDLVPIQLGTLVGEPRRVPLPVLDQAYYAGDRRLYVPDAVDADLAELAGYFMGDGSLHAKGLRFCVADADLDVVERLRVLSKGLFGLEPVVTAKQGYQEVTLQSVRLARWWQAAGLAKTLPHADHSGKGWSPRVPSAVLETNDPAVYAAFLRGLFEADGTVLAGVPSLSTSTESFADEVRTVLLSLGLASTTRKTVSGLGGDVWQVRLRNQEHAIAFEEIVGFLGERKAGQLVLEPRQTGNRDRIHLPMALWELLVPAGHELRATVTQSLRKTGGVSRAVASRIFAECGDDRLGHALGYLFETVSANEDGGIQPTYDLSVPENVTYVASGFVSHNTIGLMMDCDTTGVEPDLALVKFKKLVGGGSMQIVNQTVSRALRSIGYPEEQVEAIVEYIAEHGHVVDAPGLKPEHYPVFDCAMGERSIAPMGHVRMMAAVQPFISGAISKCVVGETLVASADGLIRIGGLHRGETEDTFRDERLEISSLGGTRKTDAFYYGGVRPVRQVRLRSGHTITGTYPHRLLTAGDGGLEWKTLAEIAEGDQVAVQYGAEMWSAVPASLRDIRVSASYGNQKAVTLPEEMSDELAFLLGAYAAEGHTTRSNWTVVITNSAEVVLERVRDAWRSLFGIEARIARQRDRCPSVVVSSKAVVEFLTALGCGERASAKRIPDAVLASPRSMVLSFLQGLALDAYVTTGAASKWGICLDSPALLDDLQAVLTNLGIVHSRIGKYNAENGKTYDEVYAAGVQGQLLVSLVPFLEPDKAARAAEYLADLRGYGAADIVPGVTGRQLYELIPVGEPGRGRVGERRPDFRFLLDPRTTHVTRRTLERVASLPGVVLPEWLDQVLSDGLHFSPVQSVTDGGEREVFDLSVPETHAFVANGIMNHNTVNMPESATVEDVEKIYFEGWKLGLKALAIYRDNCKVGQPLSAAKKEKAAAEPEAAVEKVVEKVVEYRPVRKRLPKKRPSETVSFSVGGAEGYLTASSYPDDGLGEVFLKMSKQGSTLAGVMDAFSVAISIGLQYGVPLETYVSKFTNMRFEPAGMTDDPDVRMASSVMDYIFRRLALDFLPYERRAELGIFTAKERAAQLRAEAEAENGVDLAAMAASAPVETRPEQAATSAEAPAGATGTAVNGAEVAAAKPAPQVGSSTELLEAVIGKAADAPLCFTCGTKMRPAGSCYVCEGCGSTSGCS